MTDENTAAENHASVREAEAFSELLRIARLLRTEDGCPWDRAQDLASFAECVTNEAHELLEAARSGDSAHAREEFGDVFFSLIAAAAAAEEHGQFRLLDALREAAEKMIRRHPHVFGEAKADTAEEALENWRQVKANETRLPG
jgi:uncharacterized protein YabN with tetrapyrrole methylase and pyrophosphatase domain